MAKLLILLLLSVSAFAEDKLDKFALYNAVIKTHEVLPTVIFPPFGGDVMAEKSKLTTYLLGELLGEFKLDNVCLDTLFINALADNSSEPFYGRGKQYILKTIDNKFYKIYYENDKRISEEFRGTRFIISILQKIAVKEDLFVLGAKGGGTSNNKTLLEVFKNLETKSSE